MLFTVPTPLGPMRLTTILTVVVICLIVWLRTTKPLAVVLAVAAFLASYEVIWNATDVAVHGWSWASWWWWLALGVAWTGWAWREGVRPNVALLVAFAVAHTLWILSGFHFNQAGHSFSLSAEVWNVGSKSLFAAAWALSAPQLKGLPIALRDMNRVRVVGRRSQPHGVTADR